MAPAPEDPAQAMALFYLDNPDLLGGSDEELAAKLATWVADHNASASAHMEIARLLAEQRLPGLTGRESSRRHRHADGAPEPESRGLTVSRICAAYREAQERWRGRRPSRAKVVAILKKSGWPFVSDKTLSRAQEDLGIRGWPPPGAESTK